MACASDPSTALIDFMSDAASTFTFEGYDIDKKHGQLSFYYSMFHEGAAISFTEQLSFSKDLISGASWSSPPIEEILHALLIVLGMSYWKLYCPKILRIKPFTLSRKQAVFWDLVYTKGLGEFFYRNNIDFRDLVHFPFDETVTTKAHRIQTEDVSLVLLGGGKDSIVTSELLKSWNTSFSLFCMNFFAIHERVAQKVGKSVASMERTIDKKLLDLNRKPGTYNGHVPISSIYAFMGILAAVLCGRRYVIASNEETASYGNVNYLGSEINHQWSKSFEFEVAFQEYVKDSITPDVIYFSLLRPMREIKIAELFIRYRQYFGMFTSCNRNFTQTKKPSTLWCGECSKCAFVFLLLSAFLEKNDLFSIFQKNLFSDNSLISVYQELLGLRGFKPFECVGTPEESKAAFYLMKKKGEFENDTVVLEITKSFGDDVERFGDLVPRVLALSQDHKIPEPFAGSIMSL